MRAFSVFLLLFAAPAAAGPPMLELLQTGDDNRGWEAVGKIDLDGRGFCTGVLISDDMVLTAAHCLFDQQTGAQIDVTGITFSAGLRNGRAEAYRSIRRALAHPEYVYGGQDKLDRVAFDLALLQLDSPIRLASVVPFETDSQPVTGDAVDIVSYAEGREDSPSLERACEVLAEQPGILVLSCSVDFGASGAPVFSLRGGVARVVSVVSAKADVAGRAVALGTALQDPLALLQERMAQAIGGGVRAGGAKFVRP